MVTQQQPAKAKANSVVGRLRVVASCALAGAALGGLLFGWAPVALGFLGVHELGAIVGAGVGVLVNSKHLV